MKKKLFLILSGIMVWSLVACGSPSAGGESSSAAGSSETVTSEQSSVVESTESAAPESSQPESSEPEVVEEYHLKDLFAQHGMKVGTCLSPQMIRDPSVSKLILSQFNSVTMENDMKPEAILNKSKSVQEGTLVVKFGDNLIKMLDWAKENGLSLRGHTIVWHSQTPDWIFYEDFDTSKELVSREVMLQRLDDYMRQIFEQLTEKGYIDMFYAYDVANECWEDDGSMRDSKWKQVIGDDYLVQVFTIANKYAPESIDLYYNDFNEQFKTQTFVKFLQTLKDEEGNYLIDGVGFQAHLYTKDDLNQYFRNMDTIAELGLKIQLTELDVSLGAWQNTLPGTDENLRVQGRYYYDLINGIFERVDAGTVNSDALTFWGFADNQSWRKEAKPLLYEKNTVPKYAYYGAMQIKELAGFEE